MAELLAKRRRSKIPSCTFEQFKATLEENTSILHCMTSCCYRATSPSTSITLEGPTICTRSFNLDCLRVAKTSRKGDMRCSIRPWTQCLSIIIESGSFFGVIWGLLRVKDCSSIKRDHPLQHFTCDVHREGDGQEVRWGIVQQSVSVSHCTAKNCYEIELALWTWRENVLRPPSKHKGNCDGGTYKETCSGEIDFRIQGSPHSAVQEHDHIRKEAVQKSIHQFETHPNKETVQADPKQNRGFNPFSEQSKEIIPTSLRRQSEPDAKILSFSCLTVQVPTAPWIKEKIIKSPSDLKERLYRESGKANPRLHPREQVRQRPDQPSAWHDEGSERVDPKTGWRWYDTKPSASSSSSGWQRLQAVTIPL